MEVFGAVVSAASTVAKLLADKKQANKESKELSDLHSVIQAVCVKPACMAVQVGPWRLVRVC